MPTKIEIRGVIIPNNLQWIYDYFEVEATSPARVNKLIQEANGDDLEVIINSGGGDVFSGSEIYTSLKEYKGNSVGKIVGVAASAASVAAMGVKKLLMSPTGQLMIHNAATGKWGDKHAHQHTADFLNSIDSGIANSYRLKTGMSQQELLALMSKETWMNAQEAKQSGFIDEIMFDGDDQLNAVASASMEMIPQQVIDKLRNEFLPKLKGDVNQLPPENNQTADASTPQAAPLHAPNAAFTQHVPATQAQAQTAPPIDSAAQERARMKAIDAIAANIDPALVAEAKYGDNPMTAEQLALRAMTEGKLINSGLFEQAVAANQAAGTENVSAAAVPQGAGEPEFDLKNLGDVNKVFAAIAQASQAGRPQNMRRG